MTEQERVEMVEARREYYRNWRKNHPENVKRTTERYWRKKISERNVSQIETAQAIAPDILETT